VIPSEFLGGIKRTGVGIKPSSEHVKDLAREFVVQLSAPEVESN